jgi:hypothetical protein
MHNYSDFELMIEKALSNARLELEPFKNDIHNRSLLIEIDILHWILNQKREIFNDLQILKEIVQTEIDNLKIKFNDSIIKGDIIILTKSIEILQTCLFLIMTELEMSYGE